MVRFFCPFCKAVMQRPDREAGKRIACPKCKVPVTVPEPAARQTAAAAAGSSAAGSPGHSAPVPTESWWKRLLSKH